MATCGGCGAGNRDGARYCASCGGPLTEACPSCGTVSARPDARFCDRCGSPLASDASGGLARKVVTVLFADLVGSTAAQEAMDPESVRRWLDRYYAAVRGEVEAHGGRIVKLIGDGIMAVFGVPEVREDDADRAIAAARQMHAAVAELAGDLGAGAGMGLWVGAIYDLDQLDVAVRDLDQRYEARLEPEAAWIFRFQMDAFDELIAGDLDAVRLRLAPEYRHVVHAPASFGSLTTDEWLGSLAEVRPQVQDLRWFVSDVLAACPRALLYRVEIRGELEGGPFATPYIVVGEIVDGLGRRSDLYDPDQEPEARARYAELAAERPA